MLPLGILLALLVTNSLVPPRWPGSWSLLMWFPAWLVTELPLHLLVTTIALSFVVPFHPLGLALLLLSSLGLIVHIRNALRTAAVLGVTPRHRALSLALIFPFRPRRIERIRNLCYTTHGTRRMCLDIYRAAAPHAPAPNAPVFLFVHGGAWVIGHKGQQGRLLAHHLASLGWLVVNIDYRLSPRATFPDHIHDVKHAIAWVRTHIAEHGGDPTCIVIGGGSAGAHLASLAALTPNAPELQGELTTDTTVQGCVALYGVYDFVDDARVFRHRGFRTMLLERIVMKRRLADARAAYEAASPHYRVGAHAPPFLILHGTRDTLAPLEGARRFRDALRAATRAPVEYVELPGAQHAFEIFPTLRAAAVVLAIARFCTTIRSLSTENEQAPASAPRAPIHP